jgi:hypothetical protein
MVEPPPERDPLARFLDSAIVKITYKPVAMVASVVGGMLATAVFARVWRAVAGDRREPKATDASTTWADVLPAAALHGLIYATVKAVIDRASAEGFARVTGQWPGSRKPESTE